MTMQLNKVVINFFLIFSFGLILPCSAETIDAKAIITAAMNQWRGTTSHSTLSMTIHRPDWERTMTMDSWTAGEKKSLVRVLKPKKDSGNGTLLIDNNMWSFSPKVNRVIKIPSSMMNQSWMGSDFSNKDVARSADIIEQYIHSLIKTESSEGHKVYTIQSIPKEDAPIVWGKEVLRIRDDFVMLEHTFYDQDMKVIKRMLTSKIGMMGGRMVAIQQRMAKLETQNEYTEIKMITAKFDINVPDSMFSLSNLRNPRF